MQKSGKQLMVALGELDHVLKRVAGEYLVGSFAIGLVHQVGSDTLLIPDSLRIFLTTGVMGGLTTYSTFSYETVRLMETNAWPQAWINIVVTTTVALALCFLGMAVGRTLFSFRG